MVQFRCSLTTDANTTAAATASKLKDITIALQDSIIKQLAAAHNDDNMDDFTPAISAVIKARREAVITLNKLSVALQDKREQAGQTSQPEKVVSHEQPSLSPPAVSHEQPTFLNPPSHADSSPVPRASRSSSSSSWITRLRRPSGDVVPRPLPQRRSPQLSLNEAHSAPTPNTVALSPQSFHSRGLSSATTSPQISRTSGDWSLLSPPQTPREMVAITEANRYAGFCKGAWHAQHLRLSKAMEPSMRVRAQSFTI